MKGTNRIICFAAIAMLGVPATRLAAQRSTGTRGQLGDLATLDLERATRSLQSQAALRQLQQLAALANRREAQALALASQAQAHSLHSLRSLESLTALRGLAGLSSLGGLAAVDIDVADLDVEHVGHDRPLSGDEQAADSLYRRAREALGNGDYRRAAGLFQQIYRKYPKTRYASDALYFRAFALYRAGDNGDLRGALADLETLRSKFADASVASDAQTLRVRICGALARRGDERCASEVEDLAQGSSGSRATASSSQQARCPADTDDDDERIAALNALLQMDAERALPILDKVMARRDACSTALRRKAVFLISQKRDGKAADMLLAAAKNDPDKEVRGQALFWLGQTRDERAVGMLEEVLKNSPDEELQDKAIFGLSQQRSDRAQQALRNAALNESMSRHSREQAIFWLGQQRDNGVFLRELYDKLKDDQLKEKVLFSASQQRSPETSAWLLTIAQNDREPIDVRKNALFWAGQSRGISMAELGTVYGKSTDREIKEQVIFVLSQRRDSEAVDRLLDIARTEKDRELRKKAIFWLSQSKDPRVAKFLEDIIAK